MKNAFIIIVAVALVVGGAAWLMTRTEPGGQESSDTTPQQQQNDQQATGTDAEQPVSNTATVISYTNSGFSPETVGPIAVGDTVEFRNAGSSPLRVASDPHPEHNDYPGFDSKDSVAPGESYFFTFTEAGTWGFHNHLNPSHTGSVQVTAE
jgi:plastocyanin